MSRNNSSSNSSKRRPPLKPHGNTTSYASNWNGHLQTRIHTPHPHDVLSGRGGSINSHSGNVRFREWVRVRKNVYTLAANKVEKTLVAQQVIALVRNQNPPGRFLHKDPAASSTGMGWWVELDEEKVLAKTAQALREGAPQIRAMYRHEDDHEEEEEEEEHDHRPSKKQRTRKERRNKDEHDEHPHHHHYTHEELHPQLPVAAAALHTAHSKQEAVLEQLRANVLQAAAAAAAKDEHDDDDYAGLGPEEETPPLLPVRPDASMLAPPPPLSLPLPMKKNNTNLPRSHSLALSDFSSNVDWMEEDFVNPFENESVANGTDLLDTTTNGSTTTAQRSNNNNGNNGWPSALSLSLSRLARPQAPPAQVPMIIKHESTGSSNESPEAGDLGGINVLLQNNAANEQEDASHVSTNHLRPEDPTSTTTASNSSNSSSKSTTNGNNTITGVRRMSWNDENSRYDGSSSSREILHCTNIQATIMTDYVPLYS